MDEEDYVMGEEAVVQSTEVNGNGNHVESTIDPTMIALSGNLHAPFASKKEQLPILSYGEPPPPAPAVPSPTFERTLTPSATALHHSQYSSPDSDEMDIIDSPVVKVEVRIPPPPRFPPLPYSSSKTGLVYDARMRYHAEPIVSITNGEEIHPEDPRRIHEIFNEIQEAGLVQGPGESEEVANHEHCWRIQAREASRGEICLIHTPEHYDFIKSLEGKTEEELNELSNALDSIYFHNSTFHCARLAAGGAIEACRAVVRGDVRNAIAIIRPPGHHAECDQPSGFCIFNNVPIATRVCQNDFPTECRKVLILDWDVHHGNGVQHAFYQDPNVLYISLHVYKNATFYPNLPDANLDFCGEGPGLGRNVNIPWSEHGMGDAEYIHAFQEIVVPIATEFDPDLVIISAGFDAAEGDVLGGCHVTPACYAHMTHMLMRLAKGKMAVCLEGGYNLRSIARSALAVTRTLMLQAPDRLAEDLVPKESAVRVIQQVKREQSKYWKCMYPKQIDHNDAASRSARRLHDIVREWQSRVLTDEHQMMPLTVKRSGITQTFEHNIIATPEFMEAHPLLVIFHDPPSVMNQPDPITGNMELHNIWLTDVTKSYIEWGISHGFQVIDVNIPRTVIEEEDDVGFVPADDYEARSHQTRLLANYLWENYIEPNEATQVFLMGVGAAYLGVVDLLSNNENTTDGDLVVEHVIGFVSETAIHSIKRATDDTIGHWFHDHSTIFVAKDHHVWDPNRVRKLRKKYGKLKQSNHHALNDMLEEHKDEVQQLLLDKKKVLPEEEHIKESPPAEEDQPLRSPPLPLGGYTPRFASVEARQTSATPARGLPGQGPPIGRWTVQSPTPRSPRSPQKQNFRSGPY